MPTIDGKVEYNRAPRAPKAAITFRLRNKGIPYVTAAGRVVATST